MTALTKAARTLKVEITSDVICPFCIIGYRQLQSAVSKYNASHPSSPPIDPQITFLPYRLMPDLPDENQKKEDVLLKRFGKERLEASRPMMRKRLEDVGVKVDYDPQSALISSTHLAHRLLEYARLHSPSTAATSSQAALSEDLMLAHHSRGISPSDLPTLTSLAVKHSIFPTREAAEQFLTQTNEMDREVKQGYERARGMGIGGVPFFVFDEKYGVSGAVGEDAFGEVFDQILKEDPAVEHPAPRQGVTC